MLPSVVRAYEQEGWRVRLGSPRILTAGVDPTGERRYKYAAGFEELEPRDMGFTMRDLFFFRLIGDEIRPEAGLIIGNAFGMSALCLGEALRPIALDVIDAETLGEQSRIGADLTRRVAARLGLDIRLTRGYSPQDLPAACRRGTYGLMFIDGLHTDAQIIADFEGVAPLLADRCAVVFHDIGACHLDAGWSEIRARAPRFGLEPFDLTFTDTGSTVLLRGAPGLARMLRTCAGRLHDFNERYGPGHAWNSAPPEGDREVCFIPAGARIVFYGAGNDLGLYADFISRQPESVAGVLDDDPAKWGTTRLGLEVLPPDRLPSLNVAAVVISTRSAEMSVRRTIWRLAPTMQVFPRGRMRRPAELHVLDSPELPGPHDAASPTRSVPRPTRAEPDSAPLIEAR